MGKHLDSAVKAGRCAHFVDDIGIAAHTASEPLENLDFEVNQFQKAGLKLSPKKCRFGDYWIEFLRNSMSAAGISPINERTTKFIKNLKPPSSVKTLQRCSGTVHFKVHS